MAWTSANVRTCGLAGSGTTRPGTERPRPVGVTTKKPAPPPTKPPQSLLPSVPTANFSSVLIAWPVRNSSWTRLDVVLYENTHIYRPKWQSSLPPRDRGPWGLEAVPPSIPGRPCYEHYPGRIQQIGFLLFRNSHLVRRSSSVFKSLSSSIAAASVGLHRSRTASMIRTVLIRMSSAGNHCRLSTSTACSPSVSGGGAD